ncbi:GAP family protein [Glutamicibacter sp.]|uniref:GAP family protein n=1 Tax=Glutamicibacter sp. TaxID=1931995 RepID=UPI0028BF4D10|nr:GAP family protein [Glutamicibacter sp.]
MGQALGELLPLALGIAVSPLPIIAAVLLLISPRASSSAVGFLIGWLGGIIISVTVFTLLSSILPEEDGADQSQPIRGIISIVLAGGLFLLAAKQWRSRNPEAGERKQPKWMQAIDSMQFGKALGLALLLAAVNPKNLIMGASAGMILGDSDEGTASIILLIVVFTVLAGSTVMIPVVGYLVAKERLREPLQHLQVWLEKETPTIMSVLLLVLAVSALGKGIGSF